MTIKDELTLGRFGRGICPECERSMSLTKAGVLRVHGRERDIGRRFAICAGTGQPPKED